MGPDLGKRPASPLLWFCGIIFYGIKASILLMVWPSAISGGLTSDEARRRLAKSGPNASPSQNGGNIVAWWLPKRGVATADELIEIAVEDACSGLEQQVSAGGRPAHRLTLVQRGLTT
jgi:hypothetical protein